jgi:hypothetical protein
MLTMIKAALWKAMLGVGLVVGTIAMWIVMLNYMDIYGERGAYVDGRWVPTGTRWCEQYPSQSPVPWMWLSYWVTCEGGAWIPRLRRHGSERFFAEAHWLCSYVTTCQGNDSAYTWDNEEGIIFGKLTAVRHDDDDPFFEEEP